MKLNARLKYNITALGTYTWAKSLTRVSTFDNWTDLSTQKVLDANSIPQAFSLNVIYQTPHLRSGFLGSNRITRQIFSDWQISAVLRYQSGALITAPGSNDNLGTYLAGAPRAVHVDGFRGSRFIWSIRTARLTRQSS